jgi:hypothetical protein
VAAAVGVLGLGVGALWHRLAPHLEVVRTDRGWVYAGDQLEMPVAADGSFLFAGLAAGVLVAVLAWVLLRRHRGVLVLAGLVVGSLIGAWVAWRFGVWLDKVRFEDLAAAAPIGTHLQAPLELRITDLSVDQAVPAKLTGVVATQPLVAAIVYTLLAGFAADPELRPASEWARELADEERRAQSASSAPDAPAGRPGWPAPPALD